MSSGREQERGQATVRVKSRIGSRSLMQVLAGPYLAQANGLFFSRSRDVGTACRMRAQTAMTAGVILARLLKEPKVTKPLASAGEDETGGASAWK